MLQKLLENEPNNRGAVEGFLQGSLNEVLYIEDLLKKMPNKLSYLLEVMLMRSL